MDLRNPFVFSFSRFNPGQSSRRTALFQLLHDGAQPIGRLWVPSSHIVFQICRMVNKARLAHKCSSLLAQQDAQNGCLARPQRAKAQEVQTALRVRRSPFQWIFANGKALPILPTS
jgi:hypothetical protein